jgi:acid phosphatase family membrane protein YuiD
MTESNSYVYLIAPFAGWVTAQLIKILLQSKMGFNWRAAIQSGGMPSSHAAFMAALTTSVGLGIGFDTVSFAIAFAITAIVVYDATDVRRTTGQQTDLLHKLAKKQGINDKVSHDSRGHTIPQVIVGIFVGIVVGYMAVNL